MATEMMTNLECEQAVIGGLLQDNDAWDKCGSLHPKMFACHAYGLAFAQIGVYANAGVPFDAFTVSDAIKDRVDDAFGMMIDLVQATPSAANIAHYARIVRERFFERELWQVSHEIGELAANANGESIAERQMRAVQMLTSLTDANMGVATETAYQQALQDAVKHIDEMAQLPKGALLGLPTGLKALNAATGGLRRGDLTVIAGRPSMGKTVLAENIARYIASKGYKVRFQSYEMSAMDLVNRGAAAWGEIVYNNLRMGNLGRDDWAKVSDFMQAASAWSWTIDTAILDVDALCGVCRSMKRKTGLDLLVIDHLHLMKRPMRDDVGELNAISTKLKQLARELDIHVILVAQLNRGREKDANKRPTMADIRGSGGVEQDANLIILPYRPAYYDEQENPTVAELIIAKNRDSYRGTLHIGWQAEYQKFVDESDPFAQPAPLAKVVEQQDAYTV